MKWILLAFMSGSSGMGPTVPVFMTAEFDDRPACEAAAQKLAEISRGYRVLNSSITGACVPKSSQPAS